MTQRRAVGWVLLLGGAAAWRLLLFVGPQGSDDMAYSENARALAAGSWSLRSDIFALRLGYTGPLALIYAVLGAGPATLALLNMAASLVEVALARRIARRFLGDGGAWLAAALVAVFPLHVHFASEAHPDVPVAALTSAAVLLFLKKRPLPAGLCLGAAHLMKESAFFGFAVLLVIGWSSRRRDLFRALAGFLAVATAEAAAYGVATGNPLYRVHGVSLEQASTMGSAFYQSAVPTARQLFRDIPSMLLLPWAGGWPFFVFLPLAALGGVLLRRRPWRLAAWPAVLLILLTFWPISLAPYRPAMVAHPRIFLVLVLPFCILAARFLVFLPRRAAIAAVLILVPSALAAGVVLCQDARRWSEGARLVWPRVRAGGVVVSDPRTIQIFRLYAGYRDAERWVAWTDPVPSGPHLLVVNEIWTTTLAAWYEVRPPDWAREPAEPPELEMRGTSRRSLRALLAGRGAAVPGPRVAVHRVP